MSHTTTLDTDFKDPVSLRKAVEEAGGLWLGASSVRLFDGTEIDAEMAFRLPGWHFPVAVADGKLHFDNYEGAWGDVKELHKVRRFYARNVSLETLRQRGWRVEETRVENRIRIRATR